MQEYGDTCTGDLSKNAFQADCVFIGRWSSCCWWRAIFQLWATTAHTVTIRIRVHGRYRYFLYDAIYRSIDTLRSSGSVMRSVRADDDTYEKLTRMRFECRLKYRSLCWVALLQKRIRVKIALHYKSMGNIRLTSRATNYVGGQLHRLPYRAALILLSVIEFHSNQANELLEEEFWRTFSLLQMNCSQSNVLKPCEIDIVN